MESLSPDAVQWLAQSMASDLHPQPDPLPDPLPDLTPSGAGAVTKAGSAADPLMCVAGECACPPEDVGGVGGYEEVAAWVRAGAGKRHTFHNGLTAAEMRAAFQTGRATGLLSPLDVLNSGSISSQSIDGRIFAR